MIKATELRIGNLVNDRFNAEVIVCDITHTGVNLNYGYSTISIDELKPIPLTEEWLLKFGFEIGYNRIKMLDVYCKDFGILIERSNGGNFYYKKVYISSVHQLQNLYFALTNEELILKEKI